MPDSSVSRTRCFRVKPYPYVHAANTSTDQSWRIANWKQGGTRLGIRETWRTASHIECAEQHRLDTDRTSLVVTGYVLTLANRGINGLSGLRPDRVRIVQHSHARSKSSSQEDAVQCGCSVKMPVTCHCGASGAQLAGTRKQYNTSSGSAEYGPGVEPVRWALRARRR